jgi:hypothetical protein
MSAKEMAKKKPELFNWATQITYRALKNRLSAWDYHDFVFDDCLRLFGE